MAPIYYMCRDTGSLAEGAAWCGGRAVLRHSLLAHLRATFVPFAVPRAGGGVVGGGSGQGGARVESSNHIAPHCGC